MLKVIQDLLATKLIKQIKANKTIAWDFFWRAFQTGSKQGVLALILFISAKYLAPEEFGMLNYYLALFSLVVIFCNFGFSMSTARFVAQYHNTDNRKRDEVLFSSIVLITITVTAFVLLVLLSGGSFLDINKNVFIYFIPYLFLVPLANIFDGYFRGIKNFKILSLTSLIGGLISIAAAFYLIPRYSLIGAIIAQCLVYFLVVLFLLPFLKSISLKFNYKILREVVSYSLLLGLANLAFFFYSRVDILILKQFGLIVEIGHYELINRVFQILLLPAILLGQVISPDISNLAGQMKWATIIKKLKNYMPLVILSGVLLSVLVMPVGFYLFRGVFAKYYTQNFILIAVFLLVLFPFKWWGIFLTNGFMTSSGLVKINLIILVIGAVMNLSLDFLLIGRLGFIGVFLATLIVHASSTIAATIWFSKRVNTIIAE